MIYSRGRDSAAETPPTASMLSSLLAIGLVTLSGATPLPRRTNEIPIQHVAVTSLGAEHVMPNTKVPLIVTTFYPDGKDSVRVVPDAALFLSGASTAQEILDADAVWPNQADLAPPGAVVGGGGSSSYVLTAGGFFVSPSKSTGSVDLLDVSGFPGSNATKIKVSTDRKANFYHHAEWCDAQPLHSLRAGQGYIIRFRPPPCSCAILAYHAGTT